MSRIGGLDELEALTDPDGRERMALPLSVAVGNSAAPAMRAWASACTIRAIAAATSRLAVRASSMISLNSRERNDRHQRETDDEPKPQ